MIGGGKLQISRPVPTPSGGCWNRRCEASEGKLAEKREYAVRPHRVWSRMNERNGVASAQIRAAYPNPSLANEIGDQARGRRVETDDIEHVGVVGISNAEPVRRHADDDQFCSARALAVGLERLNRVNLTRPSLVIGVYNEGPTRLCNHVAKGGHQAPELGLT